MSTIAQIKNKEEIEPFFSWFEKTIGKKVINACQEFWEDRYDFKLCSVTKSNVIKNDVATKGELFFTHKVEGSKNQKVSIRFSSNFVRIFLHAYLSSSKPRFNIMELSELEAKILNNFAKFIYENIKKYFVEYKELPREIQNLKGNYNLTFLIRKEGYPSGKISLSIPKNMILPKKFEKEISFSFKDFEDACVFVGLKFGTTKITLNELKHISKEDILLLEESNINRVKIKTDNYETEFRINPDPSLIFDLNENENNNIEGDNMAKNIWDDIQIEVSAEFNKVKMTLGELKQLTTGLVIDLGDIFDNKISLVVEDKIVAKGELIIINDKYGVKIDEIISEKNEVKEEVIKTQIETKGQVAQKEVPSRVQSVEKNKDIEEDEDFDYSNFEEDKE